MEYKIPELGENIESGTVVSVLVKDGDIVKKNDTMFELETGKAVLEIPAPQTVKIVKVFIQNGQEVKIGETVLEYNPQQDKSGEDTQTLKDGAIPEIEQDSKITEIPHSSEKKLTSPNITDSQKDEPEILPAASPSVRRQSRELGIDLNTIQGSGANEKIIPDDLEKEKTKRNNSKDEAARRVPMTNLRKTIASNIEQSYFTIPQVTQHDEADITSIEEFRNKTFIDEHKISLSAIIIKVLAKGLRKFPDFNADIDMGKGEIIYRNTINIGVATDTKDGLLIPVIHDADQKTLNAIALELIKNSDKARERKLTMDEMAYSGFTLTNLGAIGGSHFTPIVRSGEVAILGTGRGSIKPCYINNTLVPRMILPLSLSYDHRLIDGAQAAHFLNWIVKGLENPWYMEGDQDV